MSLFAHFKSISVPSTIVEVPPLLPFLQKKSIAGLIISKRTPDGSPQEQHSEGNEDQGLDACSEDLIRALHSKDAKGVTAALKAVFDLMESKEDASDESYDSLNAKAAKEQE